MLRACRRALRPGGRLAFLTIQPTPGLDDAKRRRAHEVGPPGVAVATSYPSLLRSAGFGEIVATDLTAQYRSTQRAWIDASERYAAAMREAMGSDAFDDRVAGRHRTLRAIDDGILSRFRYTAVR